MHCSARIQPVESRFQRGSQQSGDWGFPLATSKPIDILVLGGGENLVLHKVCTCSIYNVGKCVILPLEIPPMGFPNTSADGRVSIPLKCGFLPLTHMDY